MSGRSAVYKMGSVENGTIQNCYFPTTEEHDSNEFVAGWTWMEYSPLLLQTPWLAMIGCCWLLIRSMPSRISWRRHIKPIQARMSLQAAIDRKRDFLQRIGKQGYGYRDTPGGYIDDWRPRELPGLILPLEQEMLSHDRLPRAQWKRGTTTKDDEDERQVYLDYAGSALPTVSQLSAIHSAAQHSIWANPHSTGPAAWRTSLLLQQTSKKILDHFGAAPGRFAGMKHPPPHALPQDCHSGYELIFTSGTTEALRIVAERFPWSSGSCREQSCGRDGRSSPPSLLVFPPNAHTSVIGMRGPALSRGATFRCERLEEFCAKGLGRSDTRRTGPSSRTGTTIQDSLSSSSSSTTHCQQYQTCDKTRNLLVIPAECNFGGTIPDTKKIVESADATSDSDSQWYTLLDLAKAASTSPIDLKDLNPTFAVLSFYKMFGEPTGLGALFVKRSCIDLLTMNGGDGTNYYFGGGSVDMVLTHQYRMAPRTEPTPLASLSHGTVHFRGIAALGHGLDELNRRGGMSRIRDHAHCLAAELSRRLKALRHANGRLAIALYGAWGGTNKPKPSRHTTKTATSNDLQVQAGPTVAFNVIREDGSYVGYNEVSKLAALNHPPIQFRTGCFCNPGACQEALEWSDEDILHNYETTGHVCGDHIDIVHGRPTGAIRASLGKDSLWEDLDALVTFLDRLFVNNLNKASLSSPKTNSAPPTTCPADAAALPEQERIETTDVKVVELYVFPIKSCAAQRVKRWKMEFPSGKLAFDREFALVDTSGTAMRLQSCPKMGNLKPTIDLEKGILKVSAPGQEDLLLDLNGRIGSCRSSGEGNDDIVKVCGDKCGGRLWGDYDTSEWFSSYLGVQCWLARAASSSQQIYAIPAAARMSTHRTGAITSLRNPHVAFANEQPLLLITKHSVDTLNKVLARSNQQLVRPRQFRPNIVVQVINRDRGDESSKNTNHRLQQQPQQQQHVEDRWSELTLINKNVTFQVKGDCARCAMVDLDPTTMEKGKTLRALATYRRQNGQITFGIFLEGIRSSNRQHCNSSSVNDDEVWLEQGDSLRCSYK
jgi:molybdenum cofactor sulfurtransferase